MRLVHEKWANFDISGRAFGTEPMAFGLLDRGGIQTNRLINQLEIAMAKNRSQKNERLRRGASRNDSDRKPNPDQRLTEPSGAMNNEVHARPPGAADSAPGVGIVETDADVNTHVGGPGRDAPEARTTAPGAQRAGTTEGRAADAARGAKGGLGRIEAPSAQGQTAYAPATGGTGAPVPGSSGIRATSDPNFTAQRADEEGTPSPEALAEQKARLKE